MSIQDRAREIAAFLSIPEPVAIARLLKGFGYQHKCVNDDFRCFSPQTDDELLNWYKSTKEYIWELSAYHADPGFNYSGACQGIAERLKAAGVKSVLCLGDGIGDLTLSLCRAGFDAEYHDLADSRTFDFARYRFQQAGERFNYWTTAGWEPDFGFAHFDAVVSLDFMEHVTDVPAWCAAVKATLNPGGLFCAQNAFDCGSGPNGSIPCHLERNDKFARAGATGKAIWDELLLDDLGFTQESSNWYRKGE